MPERREEAPELTVRDPRDPFAPAERVSPASAAPLAGVIKVGIAAAAVGLVVVIAVVHLLSTRATERDNRLNAEGSVLHVQVLQVVPVVPGPHIVTGSAAFGDALVAITVRNVSPFAFRIRSEEVAGGPPVSPGPRDQVRPGRSVVLEVTWRLRCAAIGDVAGPSLLSLDVSGPAGAHLLRVVLPPATGPAFHLAAVAGCGER